MKTWWFEIVGEDSDLCGEEFFVEADDKREAFAIAKHEFPGEKLVTHGTVSETEAEIMGFDTY